MNKFHPLTVAAKHWETTDSVRLLLDVPSNLRDEFAFYAGQHLPIQIDREGKKLRRTYSICSAEGEWPLQIGVRIQPGGQFSQFALDELKAGDSLDVMRPNGQFHVDLSASENKHYLGFAAGSGITPILSIIATVMQQEPGSRFTLFYGNRKQSTTMFAEDLCGLKNRYLDRLQLHFLFSQEEQEFDIAGGRLDDAKVRELFARFCDGIGPDEAFVCGPDSMIQTVTKALIELGFADDVIHSEHFGAPRSVAAGRDADVVSNTSSGKKAAAETSLVTVIMDGHKKAFEMGRRGMNIVDAAQQQGIDLPYSCKGGVCATCRTHVRSGNVDMASNYGLEPWEVDAGFILACQSTPNSDEVVLNYDKT